MFTRCQENLKDSILKTSHISLTIDFWPKNVTGYIGMTANFYDKNKKCMVNAALCLDKVPYPHDARTCLESANTILQKYAISSVEDQKISYITTDNGSNMKKVYSKLKTDRMHTDTFEFLDEDEEEEQILEIQSEKRLICVAHALSNSIKCAINGSIRKKILPCFATQSMLKNVLEISKKVIKINP